MKTYALSVEDREFFKKVADAAFSNPFSEKRAELDRSISGLLEKGCRPLSGVILQLKEKIGRLDETGTIKWTDFIGRDGQIVKFALLFEIFHKYIPLLDELIEKQSESDESIEIYFGGDFLTSLIKRGFSKEDSNWYFSLFFQLRRAFYFIKCQIKGECSLMRELRCSLWNNVFTENILNYEKFLWNRMEDFSTLLLGETGTGKGSAASAIGRSGFIPYDEKKRIFKENFKSAFVSINLSEYPETLIESELFGHKRGAFTGAIDVHRGLFEITSPYGSVFLDEIGDLSIPVQIKLLKVLQERVFTPVGSHEKLKFHGRVVAATNKEFVNLVNEGGFRKDFYYRICSDSITLPSLSERIRENPGELDLLVSHLVTKIAGAENDKLQDFVIEQVKKNPGKNYAWPGNVRELEQCIRSILLKGYYKPGPDFHGQDAESSFIKAIKCSELNSEQLLSGYLNLLYSRSKTYENVSKTTGLDRRTVKKYILKKK